MLLLIWDTGQGPTHRASGCHRRGLALKRTDMAIDKGKKNKALGPDDSENEQIDTEQRSRVHEAFSEIFESNCEPDE